ncbi:MAG: IS110 family transposase, partial [Chitinophagaceae bacterium]
ISMVKKLSDQNAPVRFVMEATGVYHQQLAYFLYEQGCPVTIVLPNKISNYSRTLNTKTVTDKTSSESIMMFGLERNLEDWIPPKGIYRTLQQLTRERSQLMVDRTVVLNQLHAEKAEARPNKNSISRATKRLALFDKQEKEIIKEVSTLIRTDNEVKAIVVLLMSIPGIGELTATIILAETNGFELIRNKRQLVSYAGLDVKERQSGTSIKGKPRISKKGNKHLRKAMHMPALSAKTHNHTFKSLFDRLVDKHSIKMKAAVAVQRKLLEMAFTVFKTNKCFDKNYIENLHASNEQKLIDKPVEILHLNEA